MCVAVPMKVLSVHGDRAIAQIGEVEREIGLAILPEVKAGDYVIVHAGFAIQALDEAEALETLALFAQIAAVEQGNVP